MEHSDTNNLSRQLLEYREILFSYIMAMVRDWHDAEELFQEISITILQKEKQELEVHHFKAWSREIARRTILDFWKTRKRNRQTPLTEEVMDSIEESYAAGEKTEQSALANLLGKLNECLEKLPGHLRRLIDLRYRENLDYRGIGKKVNKSTSAAQVSVYRTRLILMDCIKKTADGGEAGL